MEPLLKNSKQDLKRDFTFFAGTDGELPSKSLPNINNNSPHYNKYVLHFKTKGRKTCQENYY